MQVGVYGADADVMRTSDWWRSLAYAVLGRTPTRSEDRRKLDALNACAPPWPCTRRCRATYADTNLAPVHCQVEAPTGRASVLYRGGMAGKMRQQWRSGCTMRAWCRSWGATATCCTCAPPTPRSRTCPTWSRSTMPRGVLLVSERATSIVLPHALPNMA